MSNLRINPRRTGFTLIEVMVAMVILSILIVMIGNIFQQVSGAWNIGTQSSEVNTAGRAALNFIAQELSHAVAGPIESAPGTAAHNAALEFEIINSNELCFVTLMGEPGFDEFNRPKEALRGTVFWIEDNKLKHSRGTGSFRPYNETPTRNMGSSGNVIITNVINFYVAAYTSRADLVNDTPITDTPVPLNQLPFCVDLHLEMMSEANLRRWESLSGVSANEFRDRNAMTYSTRVYLFNRRGYAAP